MLRGGKILLFMIALDVDMLRTWSIDVPTIEVDSREPGVLSEKIPVGRGSHISMWIRRAKSIVLPSSEDTGR